MNSLMKTAINPRGPLLSEALRHGITLRQASHQERFCHVEGRGLTSDAWGAACEAVQPAVAKLNWKTDDRVKFEKSMDVVRAVQHNYFEPYFHMPAICPGSQQRFMRVGGHLINRSGEMKVDSEQMVDLGGVTSECDKVKQLAGMVDHLYYAHGWSREKVLEAVEWYENRRANGLLTAAPPQSFEHLQVN